MLARTQSRRFCRQKPTELMNTTDSLPPPPPPEPAASVPPISSAVPAGSAWDNVAERFARDYLRDRQSERRWRVFFRLSWLIVALLIVSSVYQSRSHSSVPTGPHTALIEVRGEIADGMEASAENLLPGIKSAFEDAGA